MEGEAGLSLSGTFTLLAQVVIFRYFSPLSCWQRPWREAYQINTIASFRFIPPSTLLSAPPSPFHRPLASLGFLPLSSFLYSNTTAILRIHHTTTSVPSVFVFFSLYPPSHPLSLFFCFLLGAPRSKHRQEIKKSPASSLSLPPSALRHFKKSLHHTQTSASQRFNITAFVFLPSASASPPACPPPLLIPPPHLHPDSLTSVPPPVVLGSYTSLPDKKYSSCFLSNYISYHLQPSFPPSPQR